MPEINEAAKALLAWIKPQSDEVALRVIEETLLSHRTAAAEAAKVEATRAERERIVGVLKSLESAADKRLDEIDTREDSHEFSRCQGEIRGIGNLIEALGVTVEVGHG